MIYISGISIALFISALIFNKKDKSTSDFVLLVWMLLLAAHLGLFYLNYYGDISPSLIGVHLPIPLLQAVLLYFYVASVSNQFPSNRGIILLHLSPAIISYLFLIPFFLLSSDQKIEIFNNEGKDYGLYYAINTIAIYMSGIVYVIWSILLLKKHEINIRKQFSDIEEINLKWLKLLIAGIGVIWLIVIFSRNGIHIFTGVAIFVILIGYFGIQQRAIFNEGKLNYNEGVKPMKTTQEKKEKYASSGLTDKAAEKAYKILMEQINDKRYYKEINLSLNDLAVHLDIHPNYLSQIINDKEGKNFYDFINTLRIEEFKRLIRMPENHKYTLIALAYECGFNSKSSFNRHFKKNTGITPSEYVATHNI